MELEWNDLNAGKADNLDITVERQVRAVGKKNRWWEETNVLESLGSEQLLKFSMLLVDILPCSAVQRSVNTSFLQYPDLINVTCQWKLLVARDLLSYRKVKFLLHFSSVEDFVLWPKVWCFLNAFSSKVSILTNLVVFFKVWHIWTM